MKIRLIAATIAASAAFVGSAIALAPNVSAAEPAPVQKASNVTAFANGPRVVAAPGKFAQAGAVYNQPVAGQTFSGVAIPADATAVYLNVSNNRSADAGSLTVWPKGAGKPGTPTISWDKGKVSFTQLLLTLGEDGSFSYQSTVATNTLFGVTGVLQAAPTSLPAAPAVIKSAQAVDSKLVNVGGPIRTRATGFGEIKLPAGTWRVNARGTFTGFNSTTDLPASVSVTGTFLLQRGETMGDGFANNITVGGITIPRASSATLTQDPTAAIADTFVLNAETTVYFKAFGYASDSSERDSVLKFGLNSAVFEKIA